MTTSFDDSYLRLQNKFGLQVEILVDIKKECDNYKQTHDAILDERDNVKKERDNIQKERDELEIQRNLFEKQLESLKTEYNSLKAEHHYMKAERDYMKAERDSLRNELGVLKNSRTAPHNERNDTLELECSNPTSVRDLFKDERDALEKERDTLKNENEKLNHKIHHSQVLFNNLCLEFDVLKAHDLEHKNSFATLQDKFRVIASERDTLKDRCSSFKFTRDSLKKHRRALKIELRKARKEIAWLSGIGDYDEDDWGSIKRIVENDDRVNVSDDDDDDDLSKTCKYKEAYKEEYELADYYFDQAIELATERNTLKDQCSSFKFARDSLKKERIQLKSTISKLKKKFASAEKERKILKEKSDKLKVLVKSL